MSKIMPQRRDLDFGLPADKIAEWNAGSVHISHFMNALSLFFPEGERMFIDAVRRYRDQVTDPELQKAVTAFIGQEAMHGREHEDYNAAIFARIPETEGMEKWLGRFLGGLREKMPARMLLSGTIALEHFTAIMANQLLEDPRLLEHADPKFAAIWNWHALEETEHKAVAFDVWDTVMGRGPRAYAERAAGHLLATAIFWPIMINFYLRMLRAEGRLGDRKGWRDLAQLHFGRVGFMRKLLIPWAEYFRPGFHPWDHDNSHFLARIQDVVDQLEVDHERAAA